MIYLGDLLELIDLLSMVALLCWVALHFYMSCDPMKLRNSDFYYQMARDSFTVCSWCTNSENKCTSCARNIINFAEIAIEKDRMRKATTICIGTDQDYMTARKFVKVCYKCNSGGRCDNCSAKIIRFVEKATKDRI